MRHLQKPEFEMEALFLLVSELAMSAQHDLQVAGEVFFPKKIRDSCDAFAFFVGNLQERRIFASDLGHRGVAQESDHLTREMSGAMAFADKMIDLPKDLFARRFRDGLHNLLKNVSGGGTNQIADRLRSELARRRGDRLIEDRQCVAHRAVTRFG